MELSEAYSVVGGVMGVARVSSLTAQDPSQSVDRVIITTTGAGDGL